jgi:F-type H+-transporting ATPase subunit b
VSRLSLLATASEEGGGGGNFLVPNMTFVFELIVFVVIMWVLWKFVIPVVTQAAAEREEKLRTQRDDAAQAKSSAESTESELKALMAEARADAARVREEAREQGAQIIAEMREQAQTESTRIVEHGKAQIEAERQQAVTSLRAEVGALATGLAGRIVGESLEDEARQSRVVERFLADLEAHENGAENGTTSGSVN